MIFRAKLLTFALLIWGLSGTWAAPVGAGEGSECRKTTVAIIGAGVAGVTAAQALSNNSVTDFVIVEFNAEIGGRARSMPFGYNKQTDAPYTVELGANWIQGLVSPGGAENPIWRLAKKWNVQNHYSNESSILAYNETGTIDVSALMAEYEAKYEVLARLAGDLLQRNQQDRSSRAGLSLAGWKPRKNMAAQAVEWWFWDYEAAQTPDTSSMVFGIAADNLTFNHFSDENNFVTDPRGFASFLEGEASSFLARSDPRLLLTSPVKHITHSSMGATLSLTDGTCITAAYALSTVSLGVLQSDALSFTPDLPDWKRAGIETFRMGTYTKIFLQFPTRFWPADTEFFLYADPYVRGRYPIFQSLSLPNFHPDSNILFATVVGDESYRIEAQSDEQTKAEILSVLQSMFPDAHVPQPSAFMYPRWSTAPWALGSYSNWPVGTSLEMHQNLRANVGRLWFAGEAMSAQFYGFLHGAWFEGREAGMRIAGLLKETCIEEEIGCGEHERYEELLGTTDLEEYNLRNGWAVSSFDDGGQKAIGRGVGGVELKVQTRGS